MKVTIVPKHSTKKYKDFTNGSLMVDPTDNNRLCIKTNNEGGILRLGIHGLWYAGAWQLGDEEFIPVSGITVELG